MKDSIVRYFDVGLVSFMAYPQLGDPNLSAEDFYRILKKIAIDPYFRLLEVNPIGNPDKVQWVAKLVRESGMRVTYGGHALLMANRLNPNSLDENERKKACAVLIDALPEAQAVGSRRLTFLAGHWQPETRRQAVAQLVKTIVEVSAAAKAYGISVQLEVFDHDLDKRALIGPAPLALELAQRVCEQVPDFGLMVDLSHFPQTRETSRFVLETLRPYIKHFHIGNAVIREGFDGYGDLHPRFGYPNSENDVPELVEFLRCAKASGFFNPNAPFPLSFEVKPMPGENPDLVLANAKRALQRAWAVL